jgi:hypothetical protein
MKARIYKLGWYWCVEFVERGNRVFVSGVSWQAAVDFLTRRDMRGVFAMTSKERP